MNKGKNTMPEGQCVTNREEDRKICSVVPLTMEQVDYLSSTFSDRSLEPCFEYSNSQRIAL